MDVTVDILRGELERLFSLDDLTALSRDLLGLDPKDVGGDAAKASFARALAERCLDADRVDALVDCILFRKKSVDPRVYDAVSRWGKEILEPGKTIGPFTLKEMIRESELAFVADAELTEQPGERYMLKILKRASHGDRRAVQRFLTANRLASAVDHPGIAPKLTAGELPDGSAYVAYRYVDGETLEERLARKGPASFSELRPVLKSVLEALAALHATGLVHGDLKLDHVVVTQDLRAVLVDFGGDKLRRSTLPVNGKGGGLFSGGSGVAPEVLRGRAADARSDLYALGAIVYELSTGKPVFEAETLADLALSHLTVQPTAPSTKAPPGFVSKEVDAFVLQLLEKEPSRRPRDAQAAMDSLERLGTATGEIQSLDSDAVEALVASLLAAPADVEAALALENAVASGADPKVVGDAFARAAASIAGIGPSDQEAKRSLLYRAGRTFDVYARDKEQAESVYLALVSLDASDDVAHAALADLRRQLGKYDDLVESLLERSQNAAAGEPRARIFAEIGRLYAAELEDSEQALVAYTQAFSEQPGELYALELERLTSSLAGTQAGAQSEAWTEILASVTEAIQALDGADANRTVLLEYAARWYQQHLGRSDLALMAFQQILAGDPAHEKANAGLTGIYRSAQQWPELSQLLMARADSAPHTPRARDLRVEAAEIVETKLNDAARAREVYEKVLAEDPGHLRAGDALFRLAEKAGDFDTLVQILEHRASARGGAERLEAMVRAAEIYEDHLNDIAEASRRFEAVLSTDPKNMNALRGLDRIYNRTGKYRELLDTLERQVQAAATPRQKMGLFERIAALHDEEFLDHQGAVDALGKVLALDPNNDGALSNLVRHYRAMDRFDKVVETLAQHIASATDNARKAELLLSKARVLAEQIGSPERAMKAYEAVLALSPSHAGALEALAHLKEITGDSHAALSAIEALASKAETPEARADQWMRAGRLLEARGDKDGAITRYTRALDAKPGDVAAASALRKAYRERGDAGSVVTLVEQELRSTDNDLQKARLHAELALLYKAELKQNDNAEAAAKKALELDSSNAEALLVLGDLAYEAGRYLDALKILESLVGRVQVLPSKEDGVRVLVRYVESFGKTQIKPERQTQVDVAAASRADGPLSIPPPRETNPRLGLAVDALRKFAPTDVVALTAAANVLFEHGEPASVTQLWRDLMGEHDERLVGKERAEALYQLGESARRSGELKEAVAPLVESAKLAPADPRPLRSLARIYDDLGDFESSLKLRRRRLELLGSSERFELLLEMGDIEFQKLADRSRAERSYGEALEIRPDDRKLLAKLMQLYSEEKDWTKLIDVVTRLAGFVDDAKQRAKYMHTAATISSRYLEDNERALSFYEKALEHDPSLVKAAEEAAELYKKTGNYNAAEGMYQTLLDFAKDAGDRDRMVVVLDELADLYRRFLKEPELAIDALEAAQAFDPEGKDRGEMLAELYASDPAQYLEKAVRSQAQLLQNNPYRVESYKLLRKLYTDTKHADPAWCLCQALAVLNLAEPDEERFYTRYRSKTAAPAQAVLDDSDWANLLHEDADPTLTKLFALLEPVIRRSRTQPLEQLGYDARYAIDTSMHPYPVSQTLYYAQGVLGLGHVKVFQQLENDAAPQFAGFLHAAEPAIVLGRSAFESQLDAQALTFVLGRHLSYYRPGHYVRQLVPSGTGLKAWLFAGIKLCVPNFPVAGDLQGPVAEATQHLLATMKPHDKDELAGVVSRLLREAPALDLKKWVAGIDLSADRTGFLLAHDLDTAATVIRDNPLGETVMPTKERMKELVLFGVSESYFALRKSLSVAIDS